MNLQATDGGKTLAGFEHESRDCAVRALAISADISYTQAHALLKAEGRKDRRGTKFSMSDRALKNSGAKVEHIQHGAGLTLRYATLRYNSGRYYVTVRGHALALIDGVIHDAGEIAGPRCRVLRIYHVTPQVLITQSQINELWERLDRLEGKKEY